MLSGFLATLAFPPADVRFVAFVAMVPLLLALRGASARDGAVVGAAFGVAFFGVLIVWISLVGWLAWGALVVLQTMFLIAFGLLAAMLSRGGVIARIAGTPLLFTGIEMARVRYPFGGFAFGALGSSQASGLPMLPLARVGGMLIVTLALMVLNALFAEAIAARRTAGRLLALAAAAVAIAAPAFLPLGAVTIGEPLDVALVQGNVPRGYFAGLARGRVGPEDQVIIENHLRLTKTLTPDPPDLVVWPENSLDRDPFTDPDATRAVADALEATGAPLLVGAILDGPDDRHFYNSNLLYAADGSVAGRYDKTHLVPFGEYVPWAWVRKVVPALAQVPTDGIPGKGPVILKTPGIPPLGAVICFESTYSSLVRDVVRAGAQVIVVTTNNATFERSPLARQHLAHSRMRAVETGRPVLHAAIAGVSAVIDPDGRVRQQADLFLPAILRQQISAATGMTPYVAYGAAIDATLAFAARLAALLALVVGFARRGRVQPADPDDVEPDDFWQAPAVAVPDSQPIFAPPHEESARGEDPAT